MVDGVWGEIYVSVAEGTGGSGRPRKRWTDAVSESLKAGDKGMVVDRVHYRMWHNSCEGGSVSRGINLT